MKTYKHILFDLDHTLWDFEKNSFEVLCDLFDTYNLSQYNNITKNAFTLKFKEVNHHLWGLYTRGTIRKEDIRSERFRMILKDLGAANCIFAEEIASDYLRLSPRKSNVFPYTHQVLAYLQKNYKLHIVTNGFDDIQDIKLKSAGLTGYFSEVITSEKAGSHKPHAGFFHYTLNQLQTGCTDCLMVGDNLEADIRGAKSVCIDHVYFNPQSIPHNEKVTHEITCLSQLMRFL